MIKSMTAFSRQDLQHKFQQDSLKGKESLGTTLEVSLSWEIRTVNHRHLEISLYLPTKFSSLENALKEQMRMKLGRGKLDARLVFEMENSSANTKITINTDNVKALLSARKKLESLSKVPLSLSAIDILNWEGVIEHQENNEASTTEQENVIKDLLNTTLEDLVNMRELEGSRLSILIQTRCDAISSIVKSVRLRRVEVQENLREKIKSKIAEIDVNADTNRLEQELVYQAQRLDVDEELDRLDSHIEEIQSVLKRDEPVGRRLDFLMQELNREANTLASKSNDSKTTKAAVELKVLIEQMREQCLNIE